MTEIYQILTPSEYFDLVKVIPKGHHEMMIMTMLNTGMRYKELQAFSEHLDWHDARNRAVVLPASFSKTKMDRVVHLTPAFSLALEKHLRREKELNFPSRIAMNANIKRWWFSSKGGAVWYPSVKTFRKTWESWLIFAGYDPLKVALSQGHSTIIQMHHYAIMSARLKSEVGAVNILTEGWMQ